MDHRFFCFFDFVLSFEIIFAQSGSLVASAMRRRWMPSGSIPYSACTVLNIAQLSGSKITQKVQEAAPQLLLTCLTTSKEKR